MRALAGRDEEPEWNPYVGQAAPRVYGPAPGRYGIGLDPEAGYDEAARIEAGRSWLAASATALDDGDRRDTDGIAARVAGAQAFVHLHDLPESDLLLAADYAAHQAGFAAARAALGEGAASLYHLDTARSGPSQGAHAGRGESPVPSMPAPPTHAGSMG
ncbi:cobaltochelatase subunit CobN [Sphingomonas paucimobilis]|nr:cobaltochelatase subunit CobN [Sphingomonas paucimobilis]